ncbi:MAG: NADH-quinone oxidoreductase subunit N [Verrucomicrobia bacterium]|nr:NADH-quinone oxidoreductase subunit N [Verrucomicrobiota bacterium]
MNAILTMPEMAVTALALGLLVLDLWTPADRKGDLGIAAIGGLALILAGSFLFGAGAPQYAFGGMYVLDGMALFFKRLMLGVGVVALAAALEYSKRFAAGAAEYCALILLAVSGMMWAASANHWALLFVSVELMTVTFYVLVSFERTRMPSLEAGVKYLILGALASAFLVYGVALVFGGTGTLGFAGDSGPGLGTGSVLVRVGLALVLAGLGFKIGMVPCQFWAPDVYQGAPAPTAALLAAGSKAAGFALLLRVLLEAAPDWALEMRPVLMLIAGASILYGNLCAIPQRNLKRLLGYSSIAHAGYMLLGIVVLERAGAAAILFYLAGYACAVLAAFLVAALAFDPGEPEEIPALAGLHRRSPYLAAALALSMISLAGIPPLVGFFGKFLLLKGVVLAAFDSRSFGWLAGVALAGIVTSFYYYFGVVRAIYWSAPAAERPPIAVSRVAGAALGACLVGIVAAGVFPSPLLEAARLAAGALRIP